MHSSQPEPASPPAPAVIGGRAVVVFLLALAALAAAFAWWWNYERGQRALALLGPEAALLVRTAPRVEIIGQKSADRESANQESHGAIDISHAPGLLNARASLVSDASYDWSAQANFSSPDAVIRFHDGERIATIGFDFTNRAVRIEPSGRTALLKPKTAAGWKDYLARQHAARRP